MLTTIPARPSARYSCPTMNIFIAALLAAIPVLDPTNQKI